jgi:predicted RNA methylase
MSARARTIEPEVLAVLAAGTCDGTQFVLPPRQLDRKLYARTNQVLEALGGKWNTRAKAHLFGEPCQARIEAAVDTGTFVRPDDMGWFPTPAPLAARVVELAGIDKGMRVLEPSAGEGAIAAEARKRGAEVACFEIDGARVAALMQRFGDDGRITQADFLQTTPAPIFDRCVMNPPFARRADVHHVLHALKFLKPGGRLVAIMSAGVSFREDALTRDFRALCTSIEALPEGSFRSSGTDVNTVLVMLTV